MNHFALLIAILGSIHPGRGKPGRPSAQSARSSEVFLGLDLGTSSSRWALYVSGELGTTSDTIRTGVIPSWVSFTSSGILVGKLAKDLYPFNVRNTIFDLKRLVGRPFDDVVRNQTRHWSFRVVERDGRPAIEVLDHRKSALILGPDTALAYLLLDLKMAAERWTAAGTVLRTIIAVPPYFDAGQRRAVVEVAARIGLQVMGTVEEPTASAIAHRYASGAFPGSTVSLVFDFGAGTLDITVIEFGQDIPTIIASGGTQHLGGEDFDRRIVDMVLERCHISMTHSALADRSDLWGLKAAAEDAKVSLSDPEGKPVAVEWSPSSHQSACKVVLTRKEFDDSNYDLFTRTIEAVEAVFTQCGRAREELKTIILNGGMSRYPRIHSMLQLAFPGSTIYAGDESSVAKGAALFGALMSQSFHWSQGQKLMVSQKLGVETAGGLFTTLVPCGASLPARGRQMLTLPLADITTLEIRVFEGNRLFVRDDRLLGVVKFDAPPTAGRQLLTVEIDFEVNDDGLLNVKVRHSASVLSDSRELSAPSVQRVGGIDSVCAENNVDDADERTEAWLAQFLLLERYTVSIRALLERDGEAGRPADRCGRMKLEAAVMRLESWLHTDAKGATIAVLDSWTDSARLLFTEVALLLNAEL